MTSIMKINWIAFRQLGSMGILKDFPVYVCKAQYHAKACNSPADPLEDTMSVSRFASPRREKYTPIQLSKAAVKKYVPSSFPNHFTLTSMENVTMLRRDVKENS